MFISIMFYYLYDTLLPSIFEGIHAGIFIKEIYNEHIYTCILIKDQKKYL